VKEDIFIYFTSDFHSHFENWPKIINYINKRIRYHKKNDNTYFLLDNGDFIDRYHPITEAFLGSKNIELLNECGYDAVTIGNNEGVTFTEERFFNMYNDAQFEVVCANLKPIQKAKPMWLKPYTILKTPSGIKIGLIGLTAPFNDFYQHIGFKVESPDNVLAEVLPEVEGQSDIVVLLSHLGLSEDERISSQFEGIDVIIGGHTHHLFKNGNLVKNTLLGAVGKHGIYVGEIHLTWDQSLKQLVKKTAMAVDIQEEDNDPKTWEKIAEYLQDAREVLNDPVILVKENIQIDWFQETEIMRELTNMLREWTNADFAMLNSGILLESLDKGIITKGDIHRICPHPINPVVVILKGEHILEMVRMVMTKRFMEFPLKGFGFRGKIIGRMVFSNLDVNTFLDHDGNEHVFSISIQGKPLDLEKEYLVATADMFTFGNLLPPVSRSKYKQYFVPEFIRDLLLKTLEKM
jgi:5'-nucleotidase